MFIHALKFVQKEFGDDKNKPINKAYTNKKLTWQGEAKKLNI